VPQLDITHDCHKFLLTLPPKQFRQVVTAMFELLRNPEPHDSRLLKGFPYRRVDVGEYRIIYYVEGTVLRIPLIDKRNDDEVYKKLQRLHR
jgi:mRNA interferase RelE/StbE